ncbi:helix-turn-helix domain-containing protein [Lactiplantibacillus plantarum]|uniref:helix-turn-helix domain-containing protein n=1 Tax=Lactiplantibacillus plantarum TaxID=1590 RepID=UPI0010821D21|nr:helix-turn-helix domain-containing protein [Lactiplantibacillus plantarum]MCH8625645.1 helix-turn-helix domain-containing protein [Lactiplantibacillus plantarum]MCH8632089.1 helix-turn-helix domain-containing protein [Lactiplantibacillus plantarum]MCH8635091.1 helix-turn-helix domain-containing protein [Lactiplantibacillus plantarum]QBX93927.1 XRE family transcriptional regulator [Lactiplantibacillus plantarum]
MSELSNKLTNLREQKGWTKTYVAKKLGISNLGTYANYEYGTREPDLQMLTKISDIYGVTTDYLLGKNKTPKWATKKDTIDLKDFLEANEGSMTYGGEDLTEEEKQQVRVAMATIFWKRHKHD